MSHSEGMFLIDRSSDLVRNWAACSLSILHALERHKEKIRNDMDKMCNCRKVLFICCADSMIKLGSYLRVWSFA
jgi:hypothetical protein